MYFGRTIGLREALLDLSRLFGAISRRGGRVVVFQRGMVGGGGASGERS